MSSMKQNECLCLACVWPNFDDDPFFYLLGSGNAFDLGKVITQFSTAAVLFQPPFFKRIYIKHYHLRAKQWIPIISKYQFHSQLKMNTNLRTLS